uniref:Putative capsid protein n=1 Tax=viral metagenome TaxID=1070528 RepID=A0A6M3K492_9ZZZZ
MAMTTHIAGVNEILKNLKASEILVGKGVSRGLKKAGLFLQRESQKVVPIDTGTLKNSAYTRHVGEGIKTIVMIGYTTAYGIFVHENLKAQHKEGKQAKYLEDPMKKKRNEILAIIKHEASKP